MSNLDEKILAAIRSETEQSLADLEKDAGLFELVGESFKSSFRWIVVIVFVLVLTFLGLCVYCSINFFHAVDIATKFNWFAGAAASALVVVVLRLWYFMELNRLSLKRDFKRIELQISILAARPEQQSDA